MKWRHAVDTPSTVWFNDWRVVVNSVTYLLTWLAFVDFTLIALHNNSNANEAALRDLGI